MEQKLQRDIQRCYQNWLQAQGFAAREGQQNMILSIAETLLRGFPADQDPGVDMKEPSISAIEAPTGTGKTIAYLLAALPIARARGKKLVISVSTVTLQEQLVQLDLPEVQRSIGFSFEYALAKGRGRYLCKLRLAQRLEQTDSMPLQAELYPEQEDAPTEILCQKMDQALREGRWDGDRDAWPEPLEPRVWRALIANRNQCLAKNCSHYSRCCFYAARQQMREADCIVANHDLVLSDLLLGGGGLLPSPEDSIYVFDEAHHLSEKALQRLALSTELGGEKHWLDGCEKQLRTIVQGAGAESRNTVAGNSDWDGLFDSLRTELKKAEQLLQPMLSRDDGAGFRPGGRATIRFADGGIPEELCSAAREILVFLAELHKRLENLHQSLEEQITALSSEPQREQLEIYLPVVGELCRTAAAESALWQAYACEETAEEVPQARWLSAFEESGRMQLCSSPVHSADVLHEQLWARCRAAILCSATLRSLGSFERFLGQSGLPEETALHVLPQVFNHGEAAEIIVPALDCTPKDVSRHTAAVSSYLRKALRESGGSLVLFASRRQLHDVYEALPATLRKTVLLQRPGVAPASFLKLHRRRVDELGRSAIFGLASFAEGIDLPGKYCVQLIISKLFFAAPDDPVAQTLAEWIKRRGGNPFLEIAVPDAAFKMVQACGRLLRSEQDTGRIVLLDSRAVNMPWGRAILNSLPPFPLHVEGRDEQLVCGQL